LKRHPKQHTFLSIWFGLLSQRNFQIKSFTSLSWISDNIKTLGVFHGYNKDTDDIWKKIINKMKSCTQVWKTRNLTFKGKTLIVKNFLLAQMGFETEMRGIPEKYKKEVSKPLISEHLQRKKSTPNFLSYFCNQCLPIAFQESISLLIKSTFFSIVFEK
jgi:hypothetical protein